MIYWLRTRGLDEAKRAAFDRSLAEAERRVTIRSTTVAPAVDRRALPPPSWWKGDEHATRLGAEMMRKLDGIKQ